MARRNRRRRDHVKILALDGGTHGFTWLFCLREIEEENPGFLAETDVFTGSSFGGFCSLYLARHMGELEPGESGLEVIEGCISFMRELLSFNADQAAMQRFLSGTTSMYSHDRMQAVLTDPEHLGEACLGDLHRRVIITTYGTDNPSWTSKIYDSDSREDRRKRAFEVGLESAALPIILPVRNGLANGSLGGANSSMHGITHVLGTDNGRRLKDLVVFSLGGDPNTSDLAQFASPWDGGGSSSGPPSTDAILAQLSGDPEALQFLQTKVTELRALLDQTTTPQASEPQPGFQLRHQDAQATTTAPGSTEWGWGQWLAFGASPLFFYQVITNNQATDTANQVKMLLNERTLRVAPLALLSPGQVLFMTFFGNEVATDAIVEVADLTAELWGDPQTSEALHFYPNIEQTEAFVDTYWMRRRKPRPRRGQRRSGWRRKRDKFTARRPRRARRR